MAFGLGKLLGYGDDALRLGKSLISAVRGGADDAARVADDVARATDDVLGGGWRVPNPMPKAGVRTPPRSYAMPAPAATSNVLEAATTAAPKQATRLGRVLLGPKGQTWKGKAGSLGWRIGALPAAALAAGQLMGPDGEDTLGAEIASLGIGTASPFDLRRQRLGAAYDVADQQLAAREAALNEMLQGSQAADADYANLLGSYRTNTMGDINASYGRAADEALRAAQQIEGIGGRVASDITGEGAATAAALQALAEAPAEAGTGMFTGLVPVSGDLADAPSAAANVANITAQAAQRGVNITRDDLRAAAAMAPMVSAAYGRQVDSETSMAIALSQIAGEKERDRVKYEETSRLGSERSALALDKAQAEDELLAEALAAVAPDQLQILLGRYETLQSSERGQQALAARDIRSFNDYLEANVGRATLNTLREIAGLGQAE